MDTKSVISDMLKENTGRSILDSGDFYGRGYDRNQYRNFESESDHIVEIDVYNGKLGINYASSTYHHLVNHLEYNEKMDLAFSEYMESNDSYYLEAMESFPEHLKELGYLIGGIYGEGEAFTDNTYNYENALDQVLQYTAFHISDYIGDSDDPEFAEGDYVILQIHGGCDVRGGYTMPRVFNCELDYFCIDMRNGVIGCDCGKYWQTDDTYHWYPEGCCGSGYETLSGDTDAIDLDSYDRDTLNLADEYEQMIAYVLFWQDQETGYINIDRVKDWYPEVPIIVTRNKMVCPDCGSFVK